MKTIAVLCQKGGSGKTTISIHLAVAAIADRQFPIIYDADPQANATAWRNARPSDEPPPVLPKTPDRTELARVAQMGATLAIIDCAPRHDMTATDIAAIADLVLIPVRPSPLDLAAASLTAGIVRSTGTKAAFLLNACPTNTKRPIRDMVAALEPYQLPICPVQIHHRLAYSEALYSGNAVTETHPETIAASEIRALWKWARKEIKK